MASLPPSFPGWLILILNLTVVGLMIVLGFFLKSIDVRYCIGYLVGFFVMYIAVRLKYGFWPFDD